MTLSEIKNLNLLSNILVLYRKNRSQWHCRVLLVVGGLFLLLVFLTHGVTLQPTVSSERKHSRLWSGGPGDTVRGSEIRVLKHLFSLPTERWSPYRIGRYVPENDTSLTAGERPPAYAFLCVTPDLVCDEMVRSGGFWDRAFVHDIFSLARRLSPPDRSYGKIVMDVGMNYGSFSLFASALGYRVHAFEMQPDVAATVVMSARLNGDMAQRLHVHQFAIDEKAGTSVSYTRYEMNIGMSHMVSANDQDEYVQNVTVKTIRLDMLLDRWQRETGETIPGIFFMKIDVEGHDVNALRSLGQRWLQRVDQLVMEVNDGLPVYREAPIYLVERGFLCQTVGDGESPHVHRFTSNPSLKLPSYGAIWCARAPVVRRMQRAQRDLAERSAQTS
jgi:FkbM family methyltransferase